jgi:hypothetical protein
MALQMIVRVGKAAVWELRDQPRFVGEPLFGGMEGAELVFHEVMAPRIYFPDYWGEFAAWLAAQVGGEVIDKRPPQRYDPGVIY